ncbi:MAG TPA: hypothetical protein PLO43_01360, partial [Chlamydiales bacterium]|nr:hypothetical protein [Chlamydiales bacterium]
MANVSDWQEIHRTIIDTYSEFEKTHQLNLTGEKCDRVRAYFQGATESAQNLQNHINFSGIAATVLLTVSLGSSFFSKRHPIV